MLSPRSCRRWPRPRWSCSVTAARQVETPAGPRSTGSGGSAWNARTSPATGRGASISWPSREPAGGPPARARVGGRAGRAAHLGEDYKRYQQQRPARLSPAELAAIAPWPRHPGAAGPPTTTVADRKRPPRAVIESVQVTAEWRDRERVHATVTWAGGEQTHADLSRPVARIDQLSYYPALTQRIRALAGAGLGNTAIASQNPSTTPVGLTGCDSLWGLLCQGHRGKRPLVLFRSRRWP